MNDQVVKKMHQIH